MQGSWESKDKRKPIGRLSFAPIVTAIGPVPVYLYPEVVLYVGGAGKLEGEFGTGLALSQRIRAGYVYERGAGLRAVSDGAGDGLGLRPADDCVHGADPAVRRAGGFCPGLRPCGARGSVARVREVARRGEVRLGHRRMRPGRGLGQGCRAGWRGRFRREAMQRRGLRITYWVRWFPISVQRRQRSSRGSGCFSTARSTWATGRAAPI